MQVIYCHAFIKNFIEFVFSQVKVSVLFMNHLFLNFFFVVRTEFLSSN
jgi:hypothetical protein